jgi:hypothetical protein
MILGFMQKFPWKGEDGLPEATHFREKILAIGDGGPIWTPKIHTFREDKHNRWKAGMKVQMVYRGAGYKIIDHFNKDIPELDRIRSIQKIKIEWHKETFMSMPRKHVNIYVDSRLMVEATLRDGFIGCSHNYRHVKGIVALSELTPDLIAVNDGFSGLSHFFKWFKKDFEGKILHFTDFRYE